LLAREIRSISNKWRIVESRFSEGNRGVHGHVRATDSDEAEDGKCASGEMHVDFLRRFVPDDLVWVFGNE